jgi:large subunit ribosomal protein L6
MANPIQLKPDEQSSIEIKRIYMQAKFVCYLEMIGVGYKASTDAEGTCLYLKLGFSHDVKLQVPPLVRVFCLKPTLICCTGTDLQSVTQFAATIKRCKPPEVYKGKGIRYRNEILVQKQGKKK